jgi:SSS family solute:Na+ symporter
MTSLDWIIIAAYSAGLILLGWYLGKKQKTSEDYYLAGRKISWLPIGLSTMATQLGAVSFISAPAFVALRPGGGLILLGYELALPLAMILLMAFFFPAYLSLRVISVYEFLERRFDLRTRIVMSALFQISRGLATGVAVYAAAIVLSVTLKIPLFITIILIGAVALIYELFGGIHVDIISDTIQMIVILLGLLITGIVGLHLIGGFSSISQTLDPSRFVAVDFTAHGLGDSQDFGFWPFFLGGFFLYASYYGCDQSQVQRELSARSLTDCRKSLLFNGFFRFPLVLLYGGIGLVLGTYILKHPGFLSKLPQGGYDYLLPTFILANMPAGVVGLIFIAIMAAAMSSLDSSINSLSAASLEDIYKKIIKGSLSPQQEMKLSKLFTLFWGLFCIGFAFVIGDISPTILESINKIGSAFYGPIFAVFFLGIFSRKAKPGPIILGLILGVLTNMYLWFFIHSVSWLWWNAIGFLVAITTAILGSSLSSKEFRPSLQIEIRDTNGNWAWAYLGLFLYAAGLILFLAFLPQWIKLL